MLEAHIGRCVLTTFSHAKGAVRAFYCCLFVWSRLVEMVAVRAGLFVGLVVVDDCACLVVEGKQVSAHELVGFFHLPLRACCRYFASPGATGAQGRVKRAPYSGNLIKVYPCALEDVPNGVFNPCEVRTNRQLNNLTNKQTTQQTKKQTDNSTT